ncbi:caspase family protein [Streptomyces sp. NPDC093970]|uniref:caspase, EACC1-associated type n=1 Tax=Streptomyces sp. NPDC093970 TaxID=3155076 RepID=UPI00343AB870
MDALEEAAGQAEDLLFFYYAGHGVLLGNQSELHLTFRRSVPNKAWTTLPFAYVAEVINAAPARIKIIILDCCFSGRGAKDLMGDEATAIADQLRSEGVYVLTATSGTKKAKAPIGDKYTALTGALIGTVSEGISDAGIWLTMEDLYRDAVGRMRRSKWPLPEHFNKQNASRAALFRNKAYVSEAPAELPIEGSTPLDMSRSRAVLVESYQFADESVDDISATVVDDLQRSLVHPSGSGFAAKDCRTLRNATREQIMQAVAESAFDAEDLLFIYLSGHGALNDFGELHLLASDSDFSRAWTQIEVAELLKMGVSSRAHTILIVDASYAGAVMNSAAGSEECSIIASCGPREAAYVGSGFNQILVKILREGISGAPAHLNAYDIFRAFEQGMERQRPRFSVSNVTTLPCLLENHSSKARPHVPHMCLMER